MSEVGLSQESNKIGDNTAVNSNLHNLPTGDRHDYYSGGKLQSNPWTIPREVNRLYTGRQDIGDKLAHAFKHEDGAPKLQRRFVIAGLGGIGKGEVCIKFAFDHRREYWGLFWVDCTSGASAIESFQRIGRVCGVEEPDVASVKDWLSNTPEPWLLIIYNADDPETDYGVYFPLGDGGNIIVTTRNLESKEKYSTVGHATLDQLDIVLAQELLLKAAGLPTDLESDAKEEAIRIGEELGRHTLAILHAGAYIRDSCRLEEYLGLYRRQRLRLFRSEKHEGYSTDRTVHATFEVSLARLRVLRDDGDIGAKDALDLLALLAFMHHDGELEKILASANEYASEILEREEAEERTGVLSLSKSHAAQLPDYASREGDGAEGSLRWRKACRMLMGFSLVTIRDIKNKRMLEIHPLVHNWAKVRQDMQLQSENWFRAASVLALSCCEKKGYIPIFEVLQSHVRACMGHEVEAYAARVRGGEMAAALLRFAWVEYFMFEESGYKRTIGLIIGQLQRDGQWSLASDDPSALEIRTLQGLWLMRQGDIREAVRELEHVVRIRGTKLGVDYPSLLCSQHTLAGAYLAIGRIKDAVELLEHVVRVRETKLGVDHPSLLASQHTLVGVYRSNGQIEKAVELLEHVVRVEGTKLGVDHPSLLASQHTLAGVYRFKKQIEKAVELLEHVVRVHKIKLDETHPDRLASQHALAEALNQRALEGREAGYGETAQPLEDPDNDSVTKFAFSASSSIPSTAPSTMTIEDVETAINELAELLLHDDTLTEVFTMSKREPTISPDDFETRLRRLLGAVSKRLVQEAETDLQRAATQLIKTKARDVARLVRTHVYRQGSTTANEGLKLPAVPQRTLVSEERSRSNKWLTEGFTKNKSLETGRSQRSEVGKSTGMTEKEEKLSLIALSKPSHEVQPLEEGLDSDSDDSEASEGSDGVEDGWTNSKSQRVLRSFDDVRRFLETSDGFGLLRENLRKFSERPLRQRQQLFRDWQEETSRSIPFYFLHCQEAELSFVSSDKQSRLHAWQLAFESFSNIRWNWWPLDQPRPSLAKDMVRIRWHPPEVSKKGRAHLAISWLTPRLTPKYADVSRSLAEALRTAVRSGLLRSCHAKSAFVELTPTAATRSPVAPDARDTSAVQSRPSAASDPPSNTMPTTQRPAQVHQSVEKTGTNRRIGTGKNSNGNIAPHIVIEVTSDNDPADILRGKYILLCVPGFRALEPIQLTVDKCQSDREFFRMFREVYRRSRGGFRFWFSPKCFSHCRFSKVRKWHKRKIGWVDYDVPQHREYEYSPRPPEEPYRERPYREAILEDEWYDRFHELEDTGAKLSALLMIPKRYQPFKLDAEEREDLWGLQIEYSFYIFMVVVYEVIFLVGPVAFWIWWLIIYPGDWQTAVTPLTTQLALSSAIWFTVGRDLMKML